MARRSGYNGYKTWAQWNVALWMNNDEDLYRIMKRHTRTNSRQDAAKKTLRDLQEMGFTQTPDGAKITKTGILAAMVGL